MLRYRRDDYSSGYRVWKENWPGDTFEILSYASFEELQIVVQKFPSLLGPLLEVPDDED